MRVSKDPKFIELKHEIDLEQLIHSIQGAFPEANDPRQQAKTQHPFWFLVLILLCGYLGGANTISDLAIYAEFHIDWINQLSSRQFSAPSYNTLWWIIVRLPPTVFKELLRKWFANIPQQLRDKLLVVNGKRLRGLSSDGQIVHLVELFAEEQKLVLAQEKVPNKASEPKVIDALLKDVDVNGAIISADALFANIATVNKFLGHGAYHLSVL